MNTLNAYHRKHRWLSKSLFVGPLALLTVFFTLLQASDYRFFAPETGLAFICISLLGIILGLLITLSPRSLRLLLYAIILTLVSNAIFRPFPSVPGINLDESTYSLVIFLTSLFLVWIFRRYSDDLIFTVFAALLFSSFVIPSRELGWGWKEGILPTDRTKDLPPYIHIVLDGHVGLNGIPVEFDPDREVTNSFADSYLSLGFRLYADVGIQTPPSTIISFRKFLNFDHENYSGDSVNISQQVSNFLGTDNLLFSLLESAGYSLNVIQMSHLDLCASPRVDAQIYSCRTYPFSPHYEVMLGSSLSTVDKTLVMVNAIFRRSGIAMMIDKIAEHEFGKSVKFPRWPVYVCTYCISAFTILEEFEDRISGIQRGEAFFIHVAAPHDPYQYYDENCNMIFPLRFESSEPANNFSRYLGQVTCTQSKLHEILVSLSENPVTRDAIVIIHADHGPAQYSLNLPAVRYDPASKEIGQVTYSVFFAARAPGLEAGLDTNRLQLTRLLEQIFRDSVVL